MGTVSLNLWAARMRSLSRTGKLSALKAGGSKSVRLPGAGGFPRLHALGWGGDFNVPGLGHRLNPHRMWT